MKSGNNGGKAVKTKNVDYGFGKTKGAKAEMMGKGVTKMANGGAVGLGAMYNGGTRTAKAAGKGKSKAGKMAGC